ncbi:MAG: HPr family phosphocarrier protein [Clostridia bacterium]|nr:HPr family phosphocarrier protein [Clostridia bacterium]
MTEAMVTIKSKVGLHARPAARLVQEAMRHRCKITLMASGKKADARSMIQVLALGVQCGQEVVIRTDGTGEVEALQQLVSIVNESADGI